MFRFFFFYLVFNDLSEVFIVTAKFNQITTNCTMTVQQTAPLTSVVRDAPQNLVAERAVLK